MESVVTGRTYKVKKAVLLKTDQGIMVFGSCQSASSEPWDADGCYRYCHSGISVTSNRHKSLLLKSSATIIDPEIKAGEDWYNDRANFADIEIQLNKEIFK